MGSTVSTDINVTAAAAALSLPPGSSQEEIENAISAIQKNKKNNNADNADNADKTDEEMILRKEAILIPEDTEDIHIESNITPDELKKENGLLICETSNDTPAANTRYGKGKHWKRNQKKQQQKDDETYKMKEMTVNTNPNERTQEQRRAQVRPIIDKLTELQMNMSYPAIRELYKVLNQFIKTGEDTKFKIPFPEFSRKIKGELSNAPYIPCWVKLEID
jgi:endonuclease/exonuclease/phosphatase (EEP) superfamily protein YafD